MLRSSQGFPDLVRALEHEIAGELDHFVMEAVSGLHYKPDGKAVALLVVLVQGEAEIELSFPMYYFFYSSVFYILL